MPYREPLPDDCPPDDTEEIDAPRVVYHLVRNTRLPMTISGHSGPNGRSRFSTTLPNAKPAGCRSSPT